MTIDFREARSPGVHILAVDDVDDNLIALEAVLRVPGVEVLKARSGTEALDLLLTHEVAIALIDVQMPQMDGFELAELMRGLRRTRDIPIIFVTAGTRDPQRAFQGYEAGAVDFLFKPLDSHVLKSKVDTFVQLEHKRRQLHAKVTELQDSLHLNETLMAVLGHDLRSPLSAMLLGANFLLLKGNKSNGVEDTVQDILTRIVASGERMNRMISQLLDFARIRANGSLPINLAATDLRPVCEMIAAEHAVQAGSGRISLHAHDDSRGRWDADRLAQIVSNLVANALKHGVADGPVQVEIDGSAAAQVKLAVGNLGVIPPEILPELFEPFRGKSTRDSSSDGLGLGLFIVERLVKAHGGIIGVRSEQDETWFEVLLPREPCASTASLR